MQTVCCCLCEGRKARYTFDIKEPTTGTVGIDTNITARHARGVFSPVYSSTVRQKRKGELLWLVRAEYLSLQRCNLLRCLDLLRVTPVNVILQVANPLHQTLLLLRPSPLSPSALHVFEFIWNIDG
jgi:hypothetical protein